MKYEQGVANKNNFPQSSIHLSFPASLYSRVVFHATDEGLWSCWARAIGATHRQSGERDLDEGVDEVLLRPDERVLQGNATSSKQKSVK